MKLSEVFKEAEKYLDTACASGRGICWSIGMAANRNRISTSDASAAEEYVSILLGEYPWVTAWLSSQGVPLTQITNANMAIYRRRWLLHIIQTLEEAGL